MAEWLEIILIVFIIGGIGLAILRAGQLNPEGTGSLNRKIGRIEKKLTSMETKVDAAASSEDIATLRSDLDGRLKLVEDSCEHSASSQEIETLRAEMRGDRELAKVTAAGVKRIEDFLIRKGLGG